jgi:hypothetical protein
MVSTSTDDFIEGARLEGMLTNTVGFDKIILGDGAGDTVNAFDSSNDTITLGNGNNDTVMASTSVDDTITVGNGNDTIYVGRDNTITVGTGHDSFIFEQTTPGNIGAVTVNHFDPNKDIFTFSTQLTTSVSYHDNAQGNAVITVDNSGDTITLVGVHASELHPSNFHFVDPAAVPGHRDDRADGGGLARPQYLVMRKDLLRKFSRCGDGAHQTAHDAIDATDHAAMLAAQHAHHFLV